MTVTDIQRRLAELGHNPGPADGKLGKRTLAALEAALGIKPKPAPAADDDPPWLALARKELGTKEGLGPVNNATVLGYYADAKHPEIKQDSVPWCAAFVGAMLSRAGVKPSGDLMARSYLHWGQALEKPRLGCIVVFKRGAPPSGHVAFYIGPGITVLGGNQGDAVTIGTFRPASVLGYRWPEAA